MEEEKHYFRNEYKVVTDFIESKAEHSWKHDNKTQNFSASDSRTVKFSLGNYIRLIINNRCFYLVFSHKFNDAITTEKISISLKDLPQKYSIRCAKKIIRSLYEKEKAYNSSCTCESLKNRLDKYENLLKSSYCYVVEIIENSQNSKFCKEHYKKMFVDFTTPVNREGIVLNENFLMLRFFNKLQKVIGCEEKYEFTGGLFHALKHFSINEIFIGGNYTEGKKMPSIDSFYQIIENVIKGFYFSKLSKSSRGNNFSSITEMNDGSKFKMIFYYEDKSKIYSLDTMHKVN